MVATARLDATSLRTTIELPPKPDREAERPTECRMGGFGQQHPADRSFHGPQISYDGTAPVLDENGNDVIPEFFGVKG